MFSDQQNDNSTTISQQIDSNAASLSLEDVGKEHATTVSCFSPLKLSKNSEQQYASHQQIEDKSGNKKKRTTFSSSQLENLEIRFNEQKYLTKHDRSKLAATLGLTEKHIKTWYQNRRTKWKRECSDEVWSKERENAATAMYAQHLQLKSTLQS